MLAALCTSLYYYVQLKIGWGTMSNGRGYLDSGITRCGYKVRVQVRITVSRII